MQLYSLQPDLQGRSLPHTAHWQLDTWSLEVCTRRKVHAFERDTWAQRSMAELTDAHTRAKVVLD
jgi:hypothetical protein